MKKPCRIESVETFFALLSEEGSVSGVLLLGGPLRSSHEFHLEKGKVIDESMVDGSTTRYSRAQFRRSLFANAIKQGRFWVE